jgi:integrase
MGVALRKEKLANGRFSLYLDIYISKNNHHQKRLGITLIPEKTASDKKLNQESTRLAEMIRNEYESEILHNRYGKEHPGKKFNYSFLEYFDAIVKQRYETGVNYDTWLSVQKHLLIFTNKKLKFSDINETWMENFRAYLLRKVSQNSAHTYFNKIKRAVHTAFRDRIIETDYALNVTSPKQVNTKREFLTVNELKMLVDHECRDEQLKTAFIFSCLTGLRWSDVANLKWENVHLIDNVNYIIFTIKKTKDSEMLPISQEARDLLGEAGFEHDKIFKGLRYSAWNNSVLSNWVLSSGIKKYITFHCARHTHATLLLNSGVDIFTVSKMLGHREVRTTQIYAKIVNETKVEAVNKLPNLF